MTEWIEAYPPLPDWAVRGTDIHTLVRDREKGSDGAAIVHVDTGLDGVEILFRIDGVIIFAFTNSPSYSGGEIPRFQLYAVQHGLLTSFRGTTFHVRKFKSGVLNTLMLFSGASTQPLHPPTG
jgi:hypothetical protein